MGYVNSIIIYNVFPFFLDAEEADKITSTNHWLHVAPVWAQGNVHITPIAANEEDLGDNDNFALAATEGLLFRKSLVSICEDGHLPAVIAVS